MQYGVLADVNRRAAKPGSEPAVRCKMLIRGTVLHTINTPSRTVTPLLSELREIQPPNSVTNFVHKRLQAIRPDSAVQMNTISNAYRHKGTVVTVDSGTVL